MPLLIQYLIKLSISLALVWLFYQLLLRKLTFYQSNRWYLLGYTLLSFGIALINITPLLERNNIAGDELVRIIPPVSYYTSPVIINDQVAATQSSPGQWALLALILLAGAGLLLLRLVIRIISFIRMRGKAVLVGGDAIRLYQVEGTVAPFSFGNAVFINRHLHNDEELKEIMRHEFVHVRQRHTIDILWAELLCMLNWYNPFAWLLRNAIRQNLEFIADHQVLENGTDKKQYQYLLLKVIGNNQFSIAPKFNFSSLKKRIAMMNKFRTAKVHSLKFLFMVPLVAVLLLAFRAHRTDAGKPLNNDRAFLAGDFILPGAMFTDTVPADVKPNSKGYFITVKDKSGNCIIVVKDKYGREVKRRPLDGLILNEFEKEYGEIPAPPVKDLPTGPETNSGLVADKKDVTVMVSDSMEFYEGKNRIITLSGEVTIDNLSDAGDIFNAKRKGNPLLVVDGKKIAGEYKGDPSKAHRLIILKGPEALKKYGGEGKNGVIEITTQPAGAPMPGPSQGMLFNPEKPKEGC